MSRSKKARLILMLIALLYIAYGMMQQVPTKMTNTAAFAVSLSQSHIHQQQTPDIHAHVAAGNYTVTGPTTISVQLIHRILCTPSKGDTPHVSPACGTERDLYTTAVKYQIDPVFALAFFKHESSFGRYGIAATNLGLGNIRCTPGYSCAYGFRAYSSWRAGYEDWCQLIRYYVDVWHKPTVADIVPTYAPASENDVQGYIASIEHDVNEWRAK